MAEASANNAWDNMVWSQGDMKWLSCALPLAPSCKGYIIQVQRGCTCQSISQPAEVNFIFFLLRSRNQAPLELVSPWSWSGPRWCSPHPWRQCPDCSCTPAGWSAQSCAWSCPPLCRWPQCCFPRSWGRTACSAWPWVSWSWNACRTRDLAHIPGPARRRYTLRAGRAGPTRTASLRRVGAPRGQAGDSNWMRLRSWSIPNHGRLVRIFYNNINRQRKVLSIILNKKKKVFIVFVCCCYCLWWKQPKTVQKKNSSWSLV